MEPESHPATAKVSHLTDLTTCSPTDPSLAPVPRTQNKENNVEIIEEEVANIINLKPLKDNIDLDTHVKKSSGGRFWAAASVFSKKWQNWRPKQKMKKQNDGENLGTFSVEKPMSRRYRETRSDPFDENALQIMRYCR
ncbi:Uncharacterized protein Fot_16175 [Forsythia ovata]|uniref:Uncharacterized protein n=1 Tax=Forsythia ovata TaxID=205694 RepID=A0ABD1WBA5_9LAMI